MPQQFIRITSRPVGEAPQSIRDKWIGLTLPTISEAEGQFFGVFTGLPAEEVTRGYRVDWHDAMRILGAHSHQAREWWEAHTPPFTLSFDEKCCEVVPG